MTYTIYKYPLEVIDEQTINLHDGGGLCVRFVNGEIALYAFVDPQTTPKPIKIRIFGTGRPIPTDELPNLQYVDTVVEHVHDKDLVWHVYVLVQ